MLLFGSFTEGETRSLLQKQPFEKNEKPVEKKKLQFGSLDCVTGGTDALGSRLNLPKAPDCVPASDSYKCNGVTTANKVCDILLDVSRTINKNGNIANHSIGSSNIIAASSNQLNSPKAPYSVHPSDSYKCNGVKVANKVNGIFHDVSGTKNKNENIANHSSVPSNTVDVKDLKIDRVSSATLCDDGSNQFTKLSLNASKNGSLKNAYTNGSVNGSSSKLSDHNSQNQPNGHVEQVKALLPRGLINSGNLCFLNATMQALLSCSPFVHLLQELRTRNIPKVSVSACYFCILRI